MHDGEAFLSIILWPPETDRDQRARLLAAVPTDEPTRRLLAGRDAPTILGSYPPGVADAVTAAVTSHDGDAFAPTLADIEGLGATHKIRDMRLEHGQLVLDLWRDGTRTVTPTDVQILVRARLKEGSDIGPPASPLTEVVHGTLVRPGRGLGTAGWGFGGAYGLAGALHAHLTFGPDRKPLTVSNKLDIHTADHTVYQVDADKFGFGILGDQRGHSDNVNIDHLCELLAHLAPDEVVDPYFSLWRPPAGHRRLRLPRMKVNNDDPAFAFYSRWVALLYRHLMGTA